MKTVLILTYFLLITLPFLGQSKLDSLHQRMAAKNGDEKAWVQLELSNYYKALFIDSSVYYVNKALATGRKNKDVLLQAKSLSALGEIYQIKTQLQESIEYYFKAIEIAEQNGEKTSLGTSYNGLGLSFYLLNDFEKAELYIKKGAAMKLELKDYTYYSVITTNLAALYFYTQRYTEAIKLLRDAEAILVNNNQDYYLATLYNSLGGTYQMGLQDLDSAEYFYKKGLEIAIENSILQSVITGYHNLGELSFVRKNYSAAVQNLKKAEEYCSDGSYLNYKLAVYTTLSEVYDTLRDYKNAFLYKSLQMAAKDSIFKNEKQKAIDELDIKYQTSKNQQQIQQQQEELQTAKLIAEQQKNQTNFIIFGSIILLLIVGFILFAVIQRKKATQQLEKEKSKLFENIVHEIRTPLTLINGPLQMVKKEMQHRPDLNNHIQMIENNSEKLIRLVNELLDVSKLDKGKYQLAYQSGNFNDFFATIITSFETEAQSKNIQLMVKLLQQNLLFTYPSNAVEQIVVNLVGNALKYCPTHSTVILEMKLVKQQLVLSVSDNGPGIPEKEQQKVFERFYRVKNTESVKGTGIGLSIVKELVALLQGTITLESKEGKGTKFTVSFPIENTQQDIPFVELDENKPHLLIVDDESEIIQFVSALLVKDFNVTTAHNGAVGLQKVLEIIPDIVLTDIMMPIKNGLELLQEIKSNEGTSHIPVVVFSAKTSLESRLEGLSHGADAYLPKPFNPDELQLIIKNLLQTIQRNQHDFQTNLKEEKSFEERVFTTDDYVNRAIQFVVENIANEGYSVNELASDLCVSRSQLHRKLTTLTGFSAANFVKMVRLEKAKDLLRSNWGNVTEVAYACGFNSQSYFTKSFTEYFGESPSKV